jgi:hypothetical protein
MFGEHLLSCTHSGRFIISAANVTSTSPECVSAILLMSAAENHEVKGVDDLK